MQKIQLHSFKSSIRPIFDKYFGFIRNLKLSYSQEGEDLVVDRLLGQKKDGFYVEIGCHHPYRFSNTYIFYKKGWRGICIDPLPGTKKLFNFCRPRDIAIEIGIGLHQNALTYFMFNESALNTFDDKVAKERNGLNGYKIVKEIPVRVNTLKQVLSEIKKLPSIDLMSVDVEGLDLQVLESNDWDLYRPKIIIVECLGLSIEELENDQVYIFLKNKNYFAYAKTGHSVIFKSLI